MRSSVGVASWEDDVDPLAEAVRATRMRNAADGHLALWVLQLLRATGPRGPISAREQVVLEVALALGLGTGAATKLVDVSVLLRDRLPATLRAVCDGELSWYKASILAQLSPRSFSENAAR